MHRLDEYHCNYEENDSTRRAEASALKKAEVYARILGAEVFHQGDPRGWPLYLIFKGDLQAGQDVHAVYNQVGVAVPPNY